MLNSDFVNLNQVCVVDLQLQQFEQDNVELVPDKMVLLTDTELTQYFIQTWNLDYNDPGKMNDECLYLVK